MKDFKYEIGQIVFLITDDEQKERIITGILIRANNQYLYFLACGTSETSHFEMEIASDKNWKKNG